MVSPFAIRLALGDIEQAGTVAGRLYALSTVGSILGTFLSAIVAIPLIGTQRTMLGAAALLVFGAALLLGRALAARDGGGRRAAAVPAGPIKATEGSSTSASRRYQYVQVVEPTTARACCA